MKSKGPNERARKKPHGRSSTQSENLLSQRSNIHGLSRDVPEAIQREVRQRCLFGCVSCGDAIIQYHHFDPPFSEATEHRAHGITLLCGACHDKVTRGFWSEEQVRQCNAQPYCGRHPSHALLELRAPVYLVLGSIIATGTGALLSIHGETLLQLGLNESGRPELTATLFDNEGRETLHIERSRLLFRAAHWDATMKGSQLRICRGLHDVVLEAVFRPPHVVQITSLDLRHKGWTVRSSSKTGMIDINGPATIRYPSDGAMVLGGHLDLGAVGQKIDGGMALQPYPHSRFSWLVKSGRIEQLLGELGPNAAVLHVVEYRSTRPPPDWAFRPTRKNAEGVDEFELVCAFCHRRAGIFVVPDPTREWTPAPGLCGDCSSRPAEGWQVAQGDGSVLGQFADRTSAREAGQRILATMPGARLIVHECAGAAQEILFHDLG